jgi:hypothetical protein
VKSASTRNTDTEMDSSVHRLPLFWFLVALFFPVLLATPYWNQLLVLPSDTLWLIHVGERFLEGAVLYRDIFETNPPMSVLIYLPALIVGQMIGVSSTVAVTIQTIMLALISLSLCYQRINVAQWRDGSHRAFFLLVLAIVFLILPNNMFSQREHFALMLLAPYLTGIAMIAEDRSEAKWPWRLVTAVMAGIAVLIKPHFLAVPTLAALAAAWFTYSLRPILRIETAIGLVMLCAYGIAVYFIFPAFLGDFWPILRDVYLPAKMPLSEFILSWPVTQLLLAVLVVVGYAFWRIKERQEVSIWLAAMAGFVFIYVLQGKGFIYHIYPVVGLATMILFLLSMGKAGLLNDNRALVLACAAVCLFFGTFTQRENFRAPELVSALREFPAQSQLITVTHSMEVAMNVTDQADMRWASRLHQRWLTLNTHYIIAQSKPEGDRLQALLGYQALDRKIVAEDIISAKPPLLAFDHKDRDWELWARQDPAIEAALKNYTLVGKYDNDRYSLYQLSAK